MDYFNLSFYQKINFKMAKSYFAIIFLLIFKNNCLASKISVLCTTEFCDEYVQKFPCPQLDPVCSNANKSIVLPSLTVCNCCELCFVFQDLGEDCIVGHPEQSLPKIMCKPGTMCEKGKCVKMTKPDPDFHSDYECKDGKCKCIVLENSQKKIIFGTFDEAKCTAREKQCGCSIAAYMAKQAMTKALHASLAFVSNLRCLPNGQFDPLQCIENMCGCVNQTTGFWDPTVQKVPVSALAPNNPKCFDPKRHKTGHYYTNCEKERNELMSDISWEGQGEVNLLLTHKVQCSPDGEYSTDLQ